MRRLGNESNNTVALLIINPLAPLPLVKFVKKIVGAKWILELAVDHKAKPRETFRTSRKASEGRSVSNFLLFPANLCVARPVILLTLYGAVVRAAAVADPKWFGINKMAPSASRADPSQHFSPRDGEASLVDDVGDKCKLGLVNVAIININVFTQG